LLCIGTNCRVLAERDPLSRPGDLISLSNSALLVVLARAATAVRGGGLPSNALTADYDHDTAACAPVQGRL
jgi:hypothetical protein